MAYEDQVDELRRARVQSSIDGGSAQGNALRSQPPADMSELRARLAPAPVAPAPVAAPVYTAGPDGVSTSPPPERTLREKISYQNPAEQQALRERLTPQAKAPAVPPRNVPLNTENRMYNPAKNVGGAVARVAGKVLPIAAGAGAISELGTHQINDPGVDSSVGGTINAVKKDWSEAAAQPTIAGVLRHPFRNTEASLSKGALEAGMDVGGMAAGAADAVLPGQPVTKAYQGALKSQFGDQLKIADPVALRAAVGLGDRVQLTPDAQRRVAAGETQRQPAVATQTQRPSNAGSPSVPRTIGQAAYTAQQPQNSYELGKNAVEVIRPGGDQSVQVWRPDGSSHTVASNDFYSGRTDQMINSGQRISDAARAAQEREAGTTDTERKIAVENVRGVAQQSEHSRGLIAAAEVRHDPKDIPPAPIKDMANNVTGYTHSFEKQPDGSWLARPAQGLPTAGRPANAAAAHAKAKEAVKNGWASAEQVNRDLSSWNYPTLTFGKK